jgi:hypothetical protein
MTARDRMVVIVIAALALLGGVWLLLVSPERQQAAKLGGEVTAAQAQLSTAEGQLSDAKAAQARYQSAYASLVRLGKAVPAGQETPSLIYELARASNQKNVEFASITATVSGGAGASATVSGPGSSASLAGAGFQQMPFTFVFNGSFDHLYNLFQQIDGFALRTPAGLLQVSGRLLTVQGVKLALAGSGGSPTGASGSSASASHSETLSGTITATAYVLPPGQELTGGATPAGPAGAATQSVSTSPASSTGPSTPAAIVQAKP